MQEAIAKDKRSGPSEDVWAVIIGSFLILLVLAIAFIWPAYKFTTPVYAWQGSESLSVKVLTLNNLLLLGGIGFVLMLLAAIAVHFSGRSVRGFIPGFAVILGSSVLFTDIIKAGFPGLIQAVVVVAAVWMFAMWLSRKLKVDDEFAVILASAVSICGVSAAIVAAGAIGGDKKKLSYVTTLVLLVAIPMLFLQPWIIRHFSIPEIVGGAWLGGTLDTTASVTAASELIGPTALKMGVIIKFSQNVLIGLAAFFIAWWWVARKKSAHPDSVEKPSLQTVWSRFPKFVIGFVVVSVLFSFAIPTDTTKQVSGILNSLRSLWFALAFVSIGIEAKFSDLFKVQGGRPALAFVTAQIFNLIWTLLVAYLLFSGVLFPVPQIK